MTSMFRYRLTFLHYKIYIVVFSLLGVDKTTKLYLWVAEQIILFIFRCIMVTFLNNNLIRNLSFFFVVVCCFLGNKEKR